MSSISRRDFLKLSGAFSAAAFASSTLSPLANVQAPRKVLVLLFDAMSARNLSLHGYPRETVPALSRFAERATVYHSHYSAANFTSPSTGSFFTGMYPWKHRAQAGRGLIRRDLLPQNLFELLGSDVYRLAFAQTEFANVLMNQFSHSIERNLPPTAYSIHEPFAVKLPGDPLMTSFLPPTLFKRYADVLQSNAEYSSEYPDYPKGIPYIIDSDIAYLLEDVFKGVYQEIRNTAAFPASFSYYHLYAPHNPYAPSREFLGMFTDGYKPVRKPDHPLSTHDMVYRNIVKHMQRYDQYIAQVDHEFGLLIDQLEQDGLLDDTYVIVTSDHGELFERSTTGHALPLLFDSVIHIPLIIRAPGQTARADVHTPTNTVDLFPTLLTLSGIAVPSNIDGQLLPGFGGAEDPNRAFFAMNTSKASAFAPLQQGTFSVQQGEFKLIHYRGYSKYPDAYELYNILEDPEELDDITLKTPSVARQMKDQLLTALSEADKPYKQDD